MRSSSERPDAPLHFSARVVIADEDPDRSSMAARILQNNGYRVDAICAPHLLWECVQVYAPALIVVGGASEAESGLVLLQVVRQAELMRGFAATPAIVIAERPQGPLDDVSGCLWVSPADLEGELGQAALALVSKTPHILLMEDDALQQRILHRYLTMDGAATVHAVSNGLEALDYLSQHQVAMAIFDMETPLLNGYAAARALRSQSQTLRLPILALTGHTGAEERQRCLQAGCSAHLSKPVTRQELLSATQMLLAAHNKPRPAAAALPIDLRDLAEQFLREVGAEANRRALQEPTDLEELYRFVHSAKGTSAMFNFLAISEAAQSAALAIRGNSLDSLPAHLTFLARQFSETTLDAEPAMPRNAAPMKTDRPG
jgi:CheY-like chemotaxis protein